MRRSMRRLGIVAASVVAVFLGAAIIFLALQQFFPSKSRVSAAELALQEKTPNVAEALKRDFPDDYKELVASFTDMFAAGASPENVPELIVEGKRDIVRKYSAVIPQAPDKDVKAWLAAMSQSMQKVYADEGSELCTRFSMEGVPALVEAGVNDKYTPTFDAVDALLFTMISNARTAPEPHSAATSDDFTAVADLMRKNGIPEPYIAIVFNSDIQNPDFCPAITSYLDTLLTMPGDGGQRVRSSFAQSVSR